MIGLAVSAAFGTGLFLLWWGWWPQNHAESQRESCIRRSWRRLGGERLHDEVTQAGYTNLTLPRLGLLVVLVGCAVASASLAVTGIVAIAIGFGVVAAAIPMTVVQARASRRRRHRREVWPDVVDNVASAVRAGLSLPEALAQVARRGPEQVREPFREFAADYAAHGNFAGCLDRLKANLADPAADRLVEALRIARDVGGNDLGRLLRTLSAFLRDDLRVRAELEARQSWTVSAARLAVVAPWAVLAMLATRPESLQAYQRPEGTGVLLGGGLITLVAYRVMLRIGRLPHDARVLR